MIRTLALALCCLAAPVLAQEPTAAELATRLDTLWKTRDDPQTAKDTDSTIDAGLKAFPERYELLWRAARYRWWVADGSPEAQKKQLGKEGASLAERALKLNPSGIDAKYWYGVNIGAYSQAAGILRAIGEGLESKFVDAIDACLKTNDDYEHAGPHIVKGRYYWELPWPKRDLDKSRVELNKAVEMHPESLRAWLFLAETELKDGNAKAAKEAIDKVLTGSIDYDPPEGRRSKQMAKATAEAIAEKLK